MEERLPAHLEVAALIRAAQTEGGFAAVLHKGEREAGTLLLVLCENDTNARVYERMPQPGGDRKWQISRRQDAESKQDFNLYLARRAAQDPDLWIVELDVARAERLIGLDPPTS